MTLACTVHKEETGYRELLEIQRRGKYGEVVV